MTIMLALRLQNLQRNTRSLSRISQNKSAITLDSLLTPFPYTWLRDSCQCSACIHPSTRQKLHKSSDAEILNAQPAVDGVKVLLNELHIDWVSGHRSTYPLSFLKRHAEPASLSESHRDIPQMAWDNSSIKSSPALFVSYPSLRTPSGLLAAYNQLVTHGLLFVRGVPHKQTSDTTCELRTLAAHLGEIRGTFYGETWDVKNVRNSRNIAYTNLNLDLHMDLLYFEHPPRYQILHCLRNRVHGGTSIFVDAFHAASTLRTTDPDAFSLLSHAPVPFHYLNDGHHLHHTHRTIELDADGEISHINYSPPFQAPLPLSTSSNFHHALAHFASLLAQPENRLEYTLSEGDAVLFDNRRVLHARTAFMEREECREGEETNRWLKGCYLEADALLDRRRVLLRKTG